MRAPDFQVATDEGETLPFGSLIESGPIALVFLRHLGCVFCLQHIRDLALHPELPVVFVSRSPGPETKAVREKLGSPHRFLVDPEGRLHTHFGIARGGLGQIFNLRSFREGMKAVASGLPLLSKPQTDPMELGATFVIDPQGEVVWEYRAKDAADNATAERIAAAIRGI